MSEQVTYEYYDRAEAERLARIYRKEVDPSAVALYFGKKGWVVAVRPGWKLCEICDGFGWTGEDQDRPCICVNGWRWARE